ncbi:hypothetical protein A2767_06085 [Candidatus Roizmanbacteria bacterium RIFCSPHIGHO2_01_FULL_35_10]|uniref:Uncharacterized protein n=1 Tax=Candidatus Roizmanbacteria bacterium RIFCSPLOWO2_01_FULL_35_13 TaxID=1802055 RepID=A0A1F7I7K3_9BACT|nr:MAG: hypothetical protein A2767_06085 [Candidatus Roizmanbacteria bacterium RIFCSPHIGHO2_01_FULL_35_10]OGK39323.1 MAG: hypothetical protein A3A74_05125 [Candidatus Roizmanbacteria bacterium RIFCSPLOWO2_01_FULL_35_13]
MNSFIFEPNPQSVSVTESWLMSKPAIEVKMNQGGKFASEGEILFTGGFNGCQALILRIEELQNQIRGYLSHSHTKRSFSDKII